MEWLQRWTNRPGQSLVELLVALGLAAILIPAFMAGMMATREGRAQQEQRLSATASWREAVEAVRAVRKNGWTGFAVNGTFYPIVENGNWKLEIGSETTAEGFTRSVVVSDYLRDGKVDPSTKNVLVTVSWSTPLANSVSSTLLLTRYLDNLVYTETTEAQLTPGVKSGTAVTNTAGGEVILAAGGQGDWCRPSDFMVGQLDLPKQGVADAIYAIEGQVAVGTGENASGISFANVAISNTNPPTEYAEAGYFNIPGEKNAKNVFVSANVGYVVAGDKLYSFDLTAKTGPRPILDPDGLKLDGNGTRVVVVGTYAYVAVKDSNRELQIIDVSNPGNLSAVGYADVTGKDAKDVWVNSAGTRAYIVTGRSDSQPEFFIINVAGKTGPQPLIGSYEANGMNPKAVTVVSGNRAIIVGKEAEEYQVIDITNETLPTRCGGLNVDDVKGINGIASVLEADGDAYSYIMTGDAANEFKIIEGGPGGRYAASGTFVSAAFDPGYSTSYNRVSFTGAAPGQTTLSVQTAVSADCLNYIFVDPDPASGTIPLGFNVGRCFKYKLYLTTTDPNATPVFYDLTVNYSP
ncbi:MAG: hypothetical protein UY06_C0014G0003 [Candidatus Amesbacteria bacterium GW2011_GWA2_47_70]|nr:MAG: hypothetical protein UY06_C0014G0003 [Candidatus Amesbacteria bacterium GW2011_GWA2_47_70]